MPNLGYHPELVDLFTKKGLEMVKKERINLVHSPSGKVVGKTNKITFKDGSVRYFTDNELNKQSTGHLKDF